jgi:hypothetical protein
MYATFYPRSPFDVVKEEAMQRNADRKFYEITQQEQRRQRRQRQQQQPSAIELKVSK